MACSKGNHRNQFVDAMMMFCKTGRTPSFIIAAVSMKRKIIAWFARVLKCIPVERPRDTAALGEGFIHSEGILYAPNPSLANKGQVSKHCFQ